MPHAILLALILAVTLSWTGTGSAIPVTKCQPSNHICEGRCPNLPPGVSMPSEDFQEGLCLKDSSMEVCVCWLQVPSSEPHLQTLFKCEVGSNKTSKQVMCLPPPMCFLPGDDPGCLIVLNCPCTVFGQTSFHGWYPVAALILRSKTPVPALQPEQEGDTEKPQGDVRVFSVKHLLFLLAFVIAPLLCWCLLTFFHEGKCRKKRPSPETEPMPTERVEEVEEPAVQSCAPMQQAPTAPKLESPPQYREALEPGESCLLAADCGPPPSYEDAIRDLEWQAAVHRIQEMDTE